MVRHITAFIHRYGLELSFALYFLVFATLLVYAFLLKWGAPW